MNHRLTLPNPFGGSIWYRDRTTSTMDDIRVLIRGGEPEGTIAAAGFQEAGRGRFADRCWEAAPGEALLFTLALRAPRPPAGNPPASPPGAPNALPPASLRAPSAPDAQGRPEGRPALAPSLRLALGVARYLESLGLAPRIKWPNDLLLEERKVCGILVVGSGDWLYCGIGLNLRQSGFAAGRRRPATSLLLAGRSLAPMEALAWLLPHLHAAYLDRENRAAVERRLWGMHEEIELTVHPTLPPRRGRVAGLDAEGALLLETPQGIVRCVAGE